MIKFYDILFYSIVKYYAGNKKGALASSAIVVGGLQAMNLLSLLMFIALFVPIKEYLNGLTFLFVLFVFWILTYVRYLYRETVSIEYLDKQWHNMESSRKVKMRAMIILYILVSVAAFFGSALYLYYSTKG